MGNSAAHVRLTPEQVLEMADLADAVLLENPQPAKRVRPEIIASYKDLRIIYGKYGNAFDGLLRYKSGRFTVFCNLERVDTANSRRARFTIAHELGHYFIPEHRSALESGRVPSHASHCEYESKLLVEQQADCFASNLLMPKSLFMSEARKLGRTGLEALISLASTFDTSITATAIRYVSLGCSPCLVIKWDPERYGWKWISQEAFNAGYRKTIEDKAAVIEGSATASVFAGDPLPSAGFFKRASLASVWFPFIRPGTSKDVILQEHAMPLGRFGVLTFLYPNDGTFESSTRW